MSDNSALLAFPVVVSLFAAGVNFGIWTYRRAETVHYFFALACLATAVMFVGHGLIYSADSHTAAVAGRTAVLLTAIPLQFLVVRLMEKTMSHTFPKLAIAGAGLQCALALAGLIPGVLYAEGELLRTAPLIGSYTDTALTELGRWAPFATVLLSIANGVAPFVAAPPEEKRSVLMGNVVGSSIVMSDALVLGGWVDLPYLFPILFAVTCFAFTASLLIRFVEGLAQVESSADNLQRAAEARARELRETDLHLAHGAKLAALGTLAASLAHEINNPAAFIRSNLNYLAELSERPDDDAEFEEVLAETEEGVERLRGIVAELRQMSDHSRAGFGEVALSEVVDAALPTLRFEARGDVALEARLAPVPTVRGDRNLLGQVVANLVINAIHAVRGSGASGVVSIATFADDKRAVLEVADSGPGVPAELRERIFEPFFTTKAAGHGTGLGLAMARQLVERHGGRLTLAPSERGARFHVELPLARIVNGGAR
ncbi:MAG: hypothetical protein FJ091_11170 [Deltaproteobacteria bacterium]|nr:hypothetical protein [Deltaproteobacteria bacterium]